MSSGSFKQLVLQVVHLVTQEALEDSEIGSRHPVGGSCSQQGHSSGPLGAFCGHWGVRSSLVHSLIF